MKTYRIGELTRLHANVCICGLFLIILTLVFSPAAARAQSYSENFDDGLAQGWVAVTGTWVVSGSSGAYTYDCASTGDAHPISVYTGATWNTGYTYNLSMWEGGASYGNDFGAIFNYVDSTHYHELKLTPVGTAYLRTANGGAPTVVATVTGKSITWGTWYSVSIVRSGTLATVTLGGTTLFSNVGLADLGGGNIGVSSIFSHSKFGSVAVAPNLPSPWQSQDIGAVGATGSADYSSGTFTVSGAGTGIWNTSDQFRFVYQQLSGDCSIVAKVESVQNTGLNGWEHGGIMLRESLNTDSTYAGLYETSTHGILFEARESTGDSSVGLASDSSHGCPYWLKLTRGGNTITAYTSSTGSTWTMLGSQSITMASTIYVGLAVTSQQSAILCTTVFDNVTAGTADFTPPTVSITAPTNNATVSGSSVTVSASASDNVGVTSVQFQLDGSNLGAADTTSPYSVTWDTTTTTDGSHSLTAIAYDAAGNHATSSAVNVTVSNGTASYAEDFNSGTAAGWISVTGTWVVSGSAGAYTYDCASTADAHPISIYTGVTWNTGYTYELSMYDFWAASGNDIGAIFNYVDATHYHELVLTPTGTAKLRTANGGSPAIVATVTGQSITSSTWYDVSIIRSGTAVTVTLGGTTLFNNVGLADLGAGTIGVSSLFTHCRYDDITVTTGTGPGGGGGTYATPGSYSQNFDGGSATNWTATAGTWSVGTVQNGTVYKSTSSGGTSVYTTDTWNTDYSLRATVQSNSSGATAKVGLLYNYIDASHYYKVLLAADGSAQLIENNGGSETTVASAAAGTYHGYYTGSGNKPWVDVEVVRSGTGTTVRANGWQLFNDVAQTDLGAGGIGLTDSGTTANFDNVSVTPTPVVVYSEDLSDGVANNFSANSGTWSVTSGYYRSTGGGTHDYAMYDNATWNTEYTYSVSVASSLTGSSNKLGAIYNYVDANNYYEVLLGGSGTAEIKKVVGGTTTAQGAASYVGAGGGTNTSANQWIELRILRSGTTTTVNVNGRRVFTNIIQGDLTAGEIGVSAVSNSAAKFDDLTVTNGIDRYKSTFPKIGGVYNGGQTPYNSATWQQALARHDLVMIGIYNGWNGGGTAAEAAVLGMKSYNPALLVANYTNVMECTSPQTSGQANYDCYSKLGSETGPSNGGTWTPNDWWARNTSGANVSEFSGTNETNVTYFVQPDTNGWRYPQWYANRSKTVFFDPTPDFDLWYDDNVFYQPRPSGSPIDWDRNGTNDSSTDATVKAYYRAGIADYLMRCNQLRPDLLTSGTTGGNGSDPDGYLAPSQYQGLLPSGLKEAAMGLSNSEETWAGWSWSQTNYGSLMDNTRSPHLVMFNADGTADGKAYTTSIQGNYGGGASYAFMRYALASCMLENGYFTYSPDNYNITSYLWFDEFNLYLGEAEEGPQRTAWSNGVYKRQFQNGLVLVNPRGNGDQSVNVTTLGSYKRFSGTQDSTTNNGANITGSFTLKQGDGLILLKQ